MSILNFNNLIAFSFLLFTASYNIKAQTAFWSEDFSGGAIPDGWTNDDATGNDAFWTWCGDPTTGAMGGCPAIWDDDLNQQEPFQASTADNGFATIDSDAIGAVPGGHQSQLTTNAIDCSSQGEVWLNFQTHIGVFTIDASTGAILRISANGTDWTTFTLFPGLDTNERWSDNPENIIIDISSVAANESTVYIQWEWTGDFEYFWNIDDVHLFDSNPTAANNLSLGFARTAPNFATPAPMVDTLGFGFEINNLGLDPQTNVQAIIQVEGDNGDSFELTEEVGTVDPGAIDTLVFEGFFVPDGTPGTYDMTYTLTQDQEDAFPNNNTIAHQFVITEDVFAKDDGVFVNSTRPANFQDNSWLIGNYFYIPTGGYEAHEITFSIDSDTDPYAYIGENIDIFLYEIQEDDDTDNFTDEDLNLVGFNSYSFTDEEPFDVLTADIISFETDEVGVTLEEDGEYLLMILLPNNPNIFVPYTDNPYYGFEFGDIGTVVKNQDWFLLGFGAETTAFIRMRIRESGAVGTKEPLLAENQVQIYPNPGIDLVNLHFELDAISSAVDIQIVNTMGQIVATRQLTDVQREKIEFDVSQLPSGTYHAHLRTDEGVSTKKFLIQR